jgi:hypothetical protein
MIHDPVVEAKKSYLSGENPARIADNKEKR